MAIAKKKKDAKTVASMARLGGATPPKYGDPVFVNSRGESHVTTRGGRPLPKHWLMSRMGEGQGWGQNSSTGKLGGTKKKTSGKK